jgi:hypothetical protein
MKTVDIKDLNVYQLIERLQALEKQLSEKPDGRKNRPKKTPEQLSELARKRKERHEEWKSQCELREAARLNKSRYEQFMQIPEWLSGMNEDQIKDDLSDEYNHAADELHHYAKEYSASMEKWFALSDFYRCLLYRPKTINFSVISRDN